MKVRIIIKWTWGCSDWTPHPPLCDAQKSIHLIYTIYTQTHNVIKPFLTSCIFYYEDTKILCTGVVVFDKHAHKHAGRLIDRITTYIAVRLLHIVINI